jgi:hypothetical protein
MKHDLQKPETTTAIHHAKMEMLSRACGVARVAPAAREEERFGIEGQ